MPPSPRLYNTLQIDQYSRFANVLKKNRFSVKNSKFENKTFHYFVELFETSPLMYNITDLG